MNDGGLKKPSNDINYITYILCLGHKLNTIVLNYLTDCFLLYLFSLFDCAIFDIITTKKLNFSILFEIFKYVTILSCRNDIFLYCQIFISEW